MGAQSVDRSKYVTLVERTLINAYQAPRNKTLENLRPLKVLGLGVQDLKRNFYLSASEAVKFGS